MDWFFAGYSSLTAIAFLVLLVLIVGGGIYAIAHAARTPEQAFDITGKWKKNYWIITLVACTLAAIALPGGTGMIIGAVGTLIYLLDVRPKINELRSGR